jgi:hypothetical protein
MRKKNSVNILFEWVNPVYLYIWKKIELNLLKGNIYSN